jgi:hypothetical protein
MTATTFDPAKKAATASNASVALSNANLTAACSGHAAVLSVDAVEEFEFIFSSGTEFAAGFHDGSGAFNGMPGWDGGASIAFYMNGRVYHGSAIVAGSDGLSFGPGTKIKGKRYPALNKVEWFKDDSPTPTVSYMGPCVAGKVFACVGSYAPGSCNVTANFGAVPAPSPSPTPAPAPGPSPCPAPYVCTGWVADALVPGAFVRVPSGPLAIAGTLEMLAGQTWFFEGAVITHTGPDPLFLASAANWAVLGALRCIGTGANTCMRLSDSRSFRVSGLRAAGFGCGLKIEDDKSKFGGPAQPTLWSRADRGQFDDLVFFGCADGIDSNYGGEYMLFSNTSAINCQRGITKAGGNLQFHGGNIVDCGIGVRLLTGVNNAHGGFHGMNINHCTDKAVYAESITNGETFNGCHFYGDSQTQGGIHVKDSLGVSFVGGQMDCGVVHEGTGATLLRAVTMTGGLFTATGNVVKQGCFWRDGSPA